MLVWLLGKPHFPRLDCLDQIQYPYYPYKELTGFIYKGIVVTYKFNYLPISSYMLWYFHYSSFFLPSGYNSCLSTNCSMHFSQRPHTLCPCTPDPLSTALCMPSNFHGYCYTVPNQYSFCNCSIGSDCNYTYIFFDVSLLMNRTYVV